MATPPIPMEHGIVAGASCGETGFAGFEGLGGAQATLQTTIKQTGTYAWKLDFTVNAANAYFIPIGYVALNPATYPTIFRPSGLYFDSLPSANTVVMQHLTIRPPADDWYWNTDGTITWVHTFADGTTETVGTTGVLTTGEWYDVVSYCCKDQPAAGYYTMGMLVDGVEAFQTIRTYALLCVGSPVWGSTLGAGVSRGFTMYVDNAACTWSGEYPWSTAIPQLRGLLLNPVSDRLNEWTGDYTKWDDLPGTPDDATTISEINVSTKAHVSYLTRASVAGMPNDALIASVGQHFRHHVGSGGGDKWSAFIRQEANAGASKEYEATSNPSSEWLNVLRRWNDDAAGNQFTYANFDDADFYSFGFATSETAVTHNVDWEITALGVVVWYWNSSYALATTPSVPGTALGTLPSGTLVAASFSPTERRFGSVPSNEVVNPAAGARRLGAVPSDELVPNSWV